MPWLRAATTGARVASWMDAQRHEVFASNPGEIDATSDTPEDILASASVTDLRGIEFHGDGAVRYADLIYKVMGNYVPRRQRRSALAPAIALDRTARADARSATRDRSDLRPAPDAELARDRGAASRPMTRNRRLTVERLTQPDADDLNAIVALEGRRSATRGPRPRSPSMLRLRSARLYVARQPDRRVIAFCACWLIERRTPYQHGRRPTDAPSAGIATAAAEGDSAGDRRAAGHARSAAVERRGAETLRNARVLDHGGTPAVLQIPEEDALVLWLNP